MDDFVIRKATVLDGAGVDRFVADVAVREGRISAIETERCAGDAKETIDAEGLFLAPGFIDAHCHDDLAMLRGPGRLEKVAQGVTTVVVGNCGFSLYPCTANSKEAVRKHASGLLGLTEPDEVFESSSEYRRTLEGGIGVNVVSLVGHGPLRLSVVGPENRPASGAELEAMERLLQRDLQHAAGLSLGLVYPPSCFADRRELVCLGKAAGRIGKLVAAHIRSYEAGLLEAVREFIAILRSSGAKGILSHLQAAGRPNWGLVVQALRLLEEAQDEGVEVCFDMYPYLAGSSYALQLLPPSCLSAGIEALKRDLQDASFREGLLRRLEDPHPGADGWQSKIALIGWESVLIAGVNSPSLKSLEGKTLDAAAREQGRAGFDLLVRLVLEDDGASAVILFQLSESDLHAAFTHPLHMVGSDGIPRDVGHPHPRAFGAFPRVLDELSGKKAWFRLEDAVRRMTSVPAQRFGLANRGVIQVGAVADMVLFEEGFRDLATFENPRQCATGASHVWVSGQPVLAHGKPTGALPGRFL
ncbi:MAG TPA: D-aminoacylase [Fimbriimonas sp.]|nr:D-aminoacylase [Fimbriimonas sp.]